MLKTLEKSIEIFAWLKIVISPTLIATAIGFIAYLYFKSEIIGISITILGLALGIIWANKVWKKHGTTTFLSREMATPELDQQN